MIPIFSELDNTTFCQVQLLIDAIDRLDHRLCGLESRIKEIETFTVRKIIMENRGY